VEALYTFPVPKGASVSNFSMWIGGKEMVGEVLEKQRAREIYDSYKQQRRDPGLLEQVDYKTFEMRIFPIGPDAEQRVEITYYQELSFDNDWATYVYPLATVSKAGADNKVNGRFAFSLEARSEVPIAAMESPSHGDEFIVVNHSDQYRQASLEAGGGDLNKDVVICYQAKRPRTGFDLIVSKPPKEDGYFCLTLTAGEELAGTVTGMDYVFVVDISGSMANDSKLALSRNSVDAFINSLGSEDRFEIITFNVAANTLFGQLTEAGEPSVAQAVEFLNSQKARGGTVLNPAITTAYKYGNPDRPLNVVILSDGMSEQRERAELLGLIRQKPSNAKVFCIGVGNEVDRQLLTQLAEDAGGLAAFISGGDNFARQAQAFRQKLTHPVASNLKINFDGGKVYDLEPQQLPNLYFGLPVRLYGRYRGEGQVTVTVDAEIDGQAHTYSFDMQVPGNEGGSPEIERMWAWHKVDRLLKEVDRTGSRDSVIDEIVRLGEGYSIATEYTSFLVLENDGEYQRWKIDRKNALRIERDRRTQENLRAQLDSIRDKASANLGPVEPEAAKPQQLAKTQLNRVVGQPNTAQNPVVPRTINPPRRDTGWDIDLGGGGAIDPISGSAILGLAAFAALAGRKKNRKAR